MDNNKTLSETEEMYLVTIRRICEFCQNNPVPIPEIAKELGVQPVSASQMINKLAETGYVTYLPYKGVELTPEGIKIATRILRHRRLWEVFLVKVLNMGVDEAENLACQIEHVTSRDVASRLSKFLGEPKVCYHGAPIPQDDEGEFIIPEGVPLSSLTIGQTGQVIHVTNDSLTNEFLASEGLLPGVSISIQAIGSDSNILAEINNKRIQLTKEMADSIIVSVLTKLILPGKEKQMNAVPLSNLSIGQTGIIQKINFKGSLRQKLLAMGLVIGEAIQVKRVAPLGDPIDFIIKGYDLSLRKSEANDVLVTLVKEE